MITKGKNALILYQILSTSSFRKCMKPWWGGGGGIPDKGGGDARHLT